MIFNTIPAEPLPTPAELALRMPLSPRGELAIRRHRQALIDILTGCDPRLFIVVGPCSIHDTQAALDYARKLQALADEVSDSFVLLMRVYFEKPRTTVGWKGFLNDPGLDGSHRLADGLIACRKLLLALAELGLPAATEILSLATPYYLGDLISWAAIGARTSEAQVYRELASSMQMPVGIKNRTDGNVQTAVHALEVAVRAQTFFGIQPGLAAPAIIRSRGNPHSHIVLRGGTHGPNYDAASLKHCEQILRQASLPSNIMVDCSHGNSGKDYNRQSAVFTSCVEQIAAGASETLVGLMLESNLRPGSQPLTGELAALRYGVSVTDGCIGWDTTAELIVQAHQRLRHILPRRLRNRSRVVSFPALAADGPG